MEQNVIQQIKASYSVFDAWRDLALPGVPAKSCRCPWREDRRASMSVWDEGRRWHDHGQGVGGDVIDFVRHAADLDAKNAVRWCAERLGLRTERDASAAVRPTRAAVRETTKERKPEPWPSLRAGTPEERQRLAALRGFSVDGVTLAEARGLLAFGTYDAPCPWRKQWEGLSFWAVTDRSRRLVELRRMDGQMWATRDGTVTRKAHTVGHGKSFPVGLTEASAFPVIAVCEGAPDLVAALEIALIQGAEERVGVCALLGAGVSHLADECLPYFKGKHVRIFPHVDEAGWRAMRQWAEQIQGAGAAVVDAFDLTGITKCDGTRGKDLADLCRIDPACLRRNKVFEQVFP